MKDCSGEEEGKLRVYNASSEGSFFSPLVWETSKGTNWGHHLTTDACGLSLINAKIFRRVMQNNLSLVNCQRRKERRKPFCSCQDFPRNKKGQNYACWKLSWMLWLVAETHFFPIKGLANCKPHWKSLVMNLLENRIISKCHFHLRWFSAVIRDPHTPPPPPPQKIWMCT